MNQKPFFESVRNDKPTRVTGFRYMESSFKRINRLKKNKYTPKSGSIAHFFVRTAYN